MQPTQSFENIIPYSDYLYVEPVKVERFVDDRKRLELYGKVIAVGKDVVDTKVGDYVAFEEWDLKQFNTSDEREYKFVREREAICKIVL